MTLPGTKKLKQASKRTERYAANSSPLYGLPSHKRLANILGWAGTTGQLRRFSRRPENYSRYFDKSKPGKNRLIEVPAKRTKEFQTRILDLLRRIQLPEYLHSARSNRSYLSNSAAHCEAHGCTVTMDIESFYQAVTLQRVSRFFELEMRCSSDVAETLANLQCCDGHLATGSPVSPLLSFWANHDIFDEIDRRVRVRGGTFTLYIDDIGITGKGIGHTDIQWIRRVLRRAGLTLKESKSRVFRAKSAKLVTGRAFRNGISRAPNKQHRKMRDAQALLESNPNDSNIRESLTGLKQHLALLDDAKRDHHRAEAARTTRRKRRSTPQIKSDTQA